MYIDLFDKVDPEHRITANDYVKNAALPFDLDSAYHITVYGWSRSGKSNFISKIMQHHFVHKIKPQNIWIMSPSFWTDDSYTPVRNYLRENLGDNFENHIKSSPDLELLNEVLGAQLAKKLNNDDC